MKEKGIPFRGDMVRAILDGRKTQTRRIVKPQPDVFDEDGTPRDGTDWFNAIKCPYGVRGDRLWVKEAVGYMGGQVIYRAGPHPEGIIGYALNDIWRSPRFMFKKDTRIFLKITDVRVQRVQDISQEDAIAEGCWPIHDKPFQEGSKQTAVAHFRSLWDEIYLLEKEKWWAENPWVWAISFKRINA